jgi:hypothetical protein
METSSEAHSLIGCGRKRRCSDIVLDVALAGGGARLELGLPVASVDGGHQGHEDLEVEAAQAHPQGVKVPSDDPGGGQESA